MMRRRRARAVSDMPVDGVGSGDELAEAGRLGGGAHERLLEPRGRGAATLHLEHRPIVHERRYAESTALERLDPREEVVRGTEKSEVEIERHPERPVRELPRKAPVAHDAARL